MIFRFLGKYLFTIVKLKDKKDKMLLGQMTQLGRICGVDWIVSSAQILQNPNRWSIRCQETNDTWQYKRLIWQHKPEKINKSNYCSNYSSNSFSPIRQIRHAGAMVKGIVVHQTGGPQVMKWEDVEVEAPKEGEIRVKNKAIGLNFIDVYFRSGIYGSALPFIPGKEAVGVVTEVGHGLTGMQVGDVVAYVVGSKPIGCYIEEQVLPASIAVRVPSSIDPTTAASVMLKGMTAQVLVRRCFKVESGHTVLIHAAAGGVGSLLCQWANALGATVIGTVSTEEKAAQAVEDGCHHVINYTKEDFVQIVDKITAGKGVNVVYDSVGKDTFKGSLACLKIRGYMVAFGQSSGAPDPISLSDLAAKSLFLTRPVLFGYTVTRDELLACAGEVFANVESGVLRVRTNHVYPLSEAAKAHSDLEARKTSGSVVLLP